MVIPVQHIQIKCTTMSSTFGSETPDARNVKSKKKFLIKKAAEFRCPIIHDKCGKSLILKRLFKSQSLFAQNEWEDQTIWYKSEDLPIVILPCSFREKKRRGIA